MRWRPDITRCRYCGTHIFPLILGGWVHVVVDAAELECPVLRCPLCRGANRKEPCLRCDGTGSVGVPYPRVAIGVSLNGHARRWRPSKERYDGEALHRLHSCARLCTPGDRSAIVPGRTRTQAA